MKLLDDSDENYSEQKLDITKKELKEKLEADQKRIEELKEMSEEITFLSFSLFCVILFIA